MAWKPSAETETILGSTRVRISIQLPALWGFNEDDVREYTSRYTTLQVARVSRGLFATTMYVEATTLDSVQTSWLRSDFNHAMEQMRDAWTIAASGEVIADEIQTWYTTPLDAILPDISTTQAVGLVAIAIIVLAGIYVAAQAKKAVS